MTRVRHKIPDAIGRPRFVIGARRGSIVGRCDRGATTPQTKDGPPRRAGTLLDCAGVAHHFHTSGMRAFRSLARSKSVSANCTGYFVTDP